MPFCEETVPCPSFVLSPREEQSPEDAAPPPAAEFVLAVEFDLRPRELREDLRIDGGGLNRKSSKNTGDGIGCKVHITAKDLSNPPSRFWSKGNLHGIGTVNVMRRYLNISISTR